MKLKEGAHSILDSCISFGRRIHSGLQVLNTRQRSTRDALLLHLLPRLVRIELLKQDLAQVSDEAIAVLEYGLSLISNRFREELRVPSNLHAILGGQAAELRTQHNIIACVQKPGGNPFGEPYSGYDSLAVNDHAFCELTHEEQLEALRDLIGNDPEGEIVLRKVPFPVRSFLPPTPIDEVKQRWEKGQLHFDITDRAKYMSFMFATRTQENAVYYGSATTIPVVDIPLDPNAQVLHYGSGLFEGIGVERGEDGKVYVFQLQEHCKRLNEGARACGLPEIPWETFQEMVFTTIQANKDYIPPCGSGRLYIRPNFYDSGKILGVNNSHLFYLTITAFAIGTADAYFGPGDEKKSFALLENRARAVSHGAGCVKLIGNYSVTIPHNKSAGKKGFNGVIYSDPHGKEVKESHASSICFVQYQRDQQGKIIENGKHKIVIPTWEDKDILPSITVLSIKQFAEDMGFEIDERPVTIEELRNNEFDEAFAAGTAAAVTPIHEIEVVTMIDGEIFQPEDKKERRIIKFQSSKDSKAPFGRAPVTQKLFDRLAELKKRKNLDPKSPSFQKHKQMTMEVPMNLAA